jgi:hypothetical protein
VPGCRMDMIGPGQGSTAGSCKHGHEIQGSIKERELFNWLSNCFFFEQEPAPWCLLRNLE